MTIRELKDTLDTMGVKERAYDFECSHREEVYCLEQVRDGWTTYYRERGLRRDEHFFATEDEAAQHMLSLLTRDPTTRI